MKYTIYLGSKCNMNCAYCHRVSSENECRCTPELFDKVRGAESIKFMGGEPTLYMEDIKKFVEQNPQADFIITTNGKNLKEHIDYFREHNFFIIISFDGNQILRERFMPFGDYLKDYPRLGISCTLFHGNTSFLHILNEFNKCEKLIGRTITFYPHIMHTTNEYNQEYSLNKLDYDNILYQFKMYVNKYLEDRKLGVINYRYKSLYEFLERTVNSNYEYGETYCLNHKSSKLDYQGNVLNCLYMRDDKLPENYLEYQQKKLEEFPNCKTCDIYKYCGGACIKSKLHFLECYYYKELIKWYLNRRNNEK